MHFYYTLGPRNKFQNSLIDNLPKKSSHVREPSDSQLSPPASLSIEGIADSSQKHTHEHNKCNAHIVVAHPLQQQPHSRKHTTIAERDQNNNTEQPNITSNAHPRGAAIEWRLVWAVTTAQQQTEISCATGALSTHSAAQPLCCASAQLIAITFVRSDADFQNWR